jgi:hypothetical protein
MLFLIKNINKKIKNDDMTKKNFILKEWEDRHEKFSLNKRKQRWNLFHVICMSLMCKWFDIKSIIKIPLKYFK